MNTDYAFYYFAPLVSWWYLIIFGTMALSSKYNERPASLSASCYWSPACSPPSCTRRGSWKGRSASWNTVFKIQWTAKEWSFRVSLDLFIVWAGMFVAYAYIKAKELGIRTSPGSARRTRSLAEPAC